MLDGLGTRGAKLHLGYATPEAEAQALFDRWWVRARPFPHCAEEDDDSAWFKFARGFDLARIPLGANGLASAALESAKRVTLPLLAANKVSDRSPAASGGMCCHLKPHDGGIVQAVVLADRGPVRREARPKRGIGCGALRTVPGVAVRGPWGVRRGVGRKGGDV